MKFEANSLLTRRASKLSRDLCCCASTKNLVLIIFLTFLVSILGFLIISGGKQILRRYCLILESKFDDGLQVSVNAISIKSCWDMVTAPKELSETWRQSLRKKNSFHRKTSWPYFLMCWKVSRWNLEQPFPTALRLGMKWLTRFYPAGNYMFKVNNRSTRIRCKVFSNLTIKPLEQRQASLRCLCC